jgi:hypothetical protein
MDFSTLNTREAAENGAYLHWRHPITGTLLYTDKGAPSRALMRGSESMTLQKEHRKIVKARAKASANDDDGKIAEAREIDEEGKRGLAFVSAYVIRFENCFDGDRALTDTQADKEWFFGLSDSFVEQALDFVRKRESFFGANSAD